MISALLWGAGLGVGLWALVVYVFPPRPPLPAWAAAGVAGGDGGFGPGRPGAGVNA